MKNLKKLFITFIATLTAIACGEPEIPVELFDVMDKGAFARKMSQTGKYNFFDIPSIMMRLKELISLSLILTSSIEISFMVEVKVDLEPIF